MFRSTDFYIDLGTANTLIYAKSKGFQLDEPSLIVFKEQKKENELLALGHIAKRMIGKTPFTSSVVTPLKEGVICDFEAASQMLHGFVKNVRQNNVWRKPRLVISLPYKVTQHERNAVEELGKSLGTGNVHLVSEPIVAAIGAGLPIKEHRGQMIVDIGGGTSEVAIMSLGGIIAANAVRIGGKSLDDSIIKHLKFNHQFIVGEQTAEYLKMNMRPTGFLEVGGIDMTTGLPRRKKIDASMILPPVESFIGSIIAEISRTFEECPPEIAGDLVENGIFLTGGGALMHDLPGKIADHTGIPVHLSKNPMHSVAQGGAKLLEDNDLFDLVQSA